MVSDSVWVKDETTVWKRGKVLSTDDSKVTIGLEDGSEITVPSKEALASNPAHLEGLDDLTGLQHLDEPNVLHNVSLRFLEDKIYTYTGPILIALNPWKRLNVYGLEKMADFIGISRLEAPPHIFAIAEESYRAMANLKKDQSILVSGESGAGKTETTKFVMQYLAALSGGVPSGEEDGHQSIERQVLDSNPILEAFGNAKTLRNDNSSRFGKFIQIHFDNSGALCGAAIETYLLERSRVVFASEGERAYHVFYQLCAIANGPKDDQAYETLGLADLQLEQPQEYEYLAGGNVFTVPGVDDVEAGWMLVKSMHTIGIEPSVISDVLKTVAACLHLGNVSFEGTEAKGGEEGSKVSSTSSKAMSALGQCAKLLGIQGGAEALAGVLCTREVNAGGERVKVDNTVAQATSVRDAVAKGIYGRLFGWVVARVNESLFTDPAKQANKICILDIFGFESFKINSFEQLCINFANEMLQNQFNSFVFKEEQKEYEAEGIQWSYVDFFDNTPCIELIRDKQGVFALLDEQCILPGGSDESFAEAVRGIKHKHLIAPKRDRTAFTVCHYAGEVEYATEDFLDKNRDAMQDDAIAALENSDVEFTKVLFPKKKKLSAKELKEKNKAGKKGKGGKQSLDSLSSQFSKSLSELMATISQTAPHYVRCLTPNPQKMPGVVDNACVVQQLRCGGVIEAVRVTRAGFPSRFAFADFLARYGVILPSALDGEARHGCQAILEYVDDAKSETGVYQIGKTKIFMRMLMTDLIEAKRANALGKIVVRAQKVIRGWVIRRWYRRAKLAGAILSSRALAGVKRDQFLTTLRNGKAMELQRISRMSVARFAFIFQWIAIHSLQNSIRGFNARRQTEQLRRELRSKQLQAFFMCQRDRSCFIRKQTSAVIIQVNGRGFLGRRLLKRLKVEAKQVGNLQAAKQELEQEVKLLKSKLASQDDEQKQLMQQLEDARKLHSANSSAVPTSGVSEPSPDQIQSSQLVQQLKADAKQKDELVSSLQAENSLLKANIDNLASMQTHMDALESALKQTLSTIKPRLSSQQQDTIDAAETPAAKLIAIAELDVWTGASASHSQQQPGTPATSDSSRARSNSATAFVSELYRSISGTPEPAVSPTPAQVDEDSRREISGLRHQLDAAQMIAGDLRDQNVVLKEQNEKLDSDILEAQKELASAQDTLQSLRIDLARKEEVILNYISKEPGYEQRKESSTSMTPVKGRPGKDGSSGFMSNLFNRGSGQEIKREQEKSEALMQTLESKIVEIIRLRNECENRRRTIEMMDQQMQSQQKEIDSLKSVQS